MFVPEDVEPPRRVYLRFPGDGSCDLLIEGVRVLKIKGDRLYFARYVSTEITGLAVGAFSEALAEVEK